MARKPIATWFFALTVVRLGRRYLVVQENKNKLWYLPGGRVAPGEQIIQAAARECLEETGMGVIMDGIVRIQHNPRSDGTARVRVIFLAHPADDTPPKNTPDEHSIRAAWVTIEDLERIPLRGREVRELFAYIEGGGQVFPLSVLGTEAEHFRPPRR